MKRFDGYQVLDKCYFELEDVPAPLVLESWISKVQEEWEDGKLNVPEPVTVKTIFRKRGRPKKAHSERAELPLTAPSELNEPAFEVLDISTANDCLSEEDDLGNAAYSSNDYTNDPSEPNSKESKGEKSFACNLCPKKFKAESTLKNHGRIHSGNLHRCKECDRGFVTKYLLKCHERIHNGDLYRCDVCPKKSFTTAELLKIHMRRHTGEKPFVCDKCPMRFPSSSNLLQHKEIHLADRNHLCPICGATFTLRRRLACHMVIHNDKTHTCPECGKQWARVSDLQEHMRVHTKDKPYECKACHKKFSQSSTLRRHWQIHQDHPIRPYPYRCPYCPKIFRNKETAFHQHVASHL